ncbi:transposase, partial [Acinetobacter baumannii]|nr:transposase [Acinetobacter baumannii]
MKARFREFLVNAKISESEIDEALNEMFDAAPQKTLLERLGSE